MSLPLAAVCNQASMSMTQICEVEGQRTGLFLQTAFVFVDVGFYLWKGVKKDKDSKTRLKKNKIRQK